MVPISSKKKKSDKGCQRIGGNYRYNKNKSEEGG
jgi:hypothetical protein